MLGLCALAAASVAPPSSGGSGYWSVALLLAYRPCPQQLHRRPRTGYRVPSGHSRNVAGPGTDRGHGASCRVSFGVAATRAQLAPSPPVVTRTPIDHCCSLKKMSARATPRVVTWCMAPGYSTRHRRAIAWPPTNSALSAPESLPDPPAHVKIADWGGDPVYPGLPLVSGNGFLCGAVEFRTPRNMRHTTGALPAQAGKTGSPPRVQS